MTITFISNYLTHHQIPFCDELYKDSRVTFHFISTKKMELDRVNGGWIADNKKPYELLSYLDESILRLAKDLCVTSDIVIFGDCPHSFIEERIKLNPSGFSFLYSERLFKKGRWHILSPRNIFKMISPRSIYKNKNIYLLCAGGYVAKDYSLMRGFRNRTIKWGYFPKTYLYELNKLLAQKKENSILWVGRLIEWKRPLMMIELAKQLKKASIPFSLKMVGNGPLKKKILSKINKYQLNNDVSLIECASNECVRDLMAKTEVFVSTSNQEEGWGAVINEAMNGGCVVICSDKVGSAPYLIQNNYNGLIFKNWSFLSLLRLTKRILPNKKKKHTLGENAFNTIANDWNEAIATSSFLELVSSLLGGVIQYRSSGPCSRAEADL